MVAPPAITNATTSQQPKVRRPATTHPPPCSWAMTRVNASPVTSPTASQP
jgi:hypothetical protein